MKKILSYILGLGLLISSCNPMQDIFDEIDKTEITNMIKGLEYTFTAEDYSDMDGDVSDNHYFSENDPADDYIPAFLGEKYYALTTGSSVKITYNYKEESTDLDKYVEASKYSLKDEDYEMASTTVGVAGYFSPMNPADDYLPAILASSVTGANNGDVYIVSYKYSDVDPDEKELKEVTIFEHIFSTDLGDFTAVNVLGDQTWYWSSYSGEGYAKISGYSGGAVPNEDWLISPEINLDGYSNSKVNYSQTAKFVNGQWDQLTVLVSSDYNGIDPNSATWTQLTTSNMPTGNDYKFVNSGDIDISSFDGQKIYVAFKYVSSDSNAATWEFTDITVKGTAAVNKSATLIKDPITIDELYTYNSGWEKTENAYYLTSIDYDSMGEESGLPGRYNNFSSSTPPINYLPQLATLKYPYAQEGDEIVMVYKYYGGATPIMADNLFFMDGEWKIVIEKTDQYINSASGWVFDPTVNYTMQSSDYQIIVDYVAANISADHLDSYGTAEDYYGVSAYYSEFRASSTYIDDSFETWEEAVKEAVGEVFLPRRFPDAVTQVDGIDINYKITFFLYENGTMVEYSITFQCTKSGPNPEFTYVEGPTKE